MIFITGTGRSGTSEVSRVFESMGFKIGPHGPHYEDNNFKRINRRVLSGTLPYEQFINELYALPAGDAIKDPRLCYLIPFYFLKWPDAKVIICRREKYMVIKSYMKNYGVSEHTATLEVNRRENLINLYTKYKLAFKIDMSTERDETYIKNFLTGVLNA